MDKKAQGAVIVLMDNLSLFGLIFISVFKYNDESVNFAKDFELWQCDRMDNQVLFLKSASLLFSLSGLVCVKFF